MKLPRRLARQKVVFTSCPCCFPITQTVASVGGQPPLLFLLSFVAKNRRVQNQLTDLGKPASRGNAGVSPRHLRWQNGRPARFALVKRASRSFGLLETTCLKQLLPGARANSPAHSFFEIAAPVGAAESCFYQLSLLFPNYANGGHGDCP